MSAFYRKLISLSISRAESFLKFKYGSFEFSFFLLLKSLELLHILHCQLYETMPFLDINRENLSNEVQLICGSFIETTCSLGMIAPADF